MNELKERTKKFAIDVIKLISELPRTTEAKILGSQLLRSGTSAGANYREAMRARTNAEFIAKLGIIEQELAETEYWFELLEESCLVSADRVEDLKKETDELLAMTVASIRTARRRPK